MPMALFDVDGEARLLIAQPGVVEVDVSRDLYSDAKEHWIDSDDMRYPFPFRTVAGDTIDAQRSVGAQYFLTNGWKIRPHEAHHTLVFNGNLRLDEGQPPGIVVPTLGAFTVLVAIERSADSFAVSTTGTVAPSQQQIRDAMTLSRTQAPVAGSLDADVLQIQSDTAATLMLVADIDARLPTAPSSAADLAAVAASVWDELSAAHLAPGSMGLVLAELWRLAALDPGRPLEVSPAQRRAGAEIKQIITAVGDTVTVQRT